jgi:hypothetical protein
MPLAFQHIEDLARREQPGGKSNRHEQNSGGAKVVVKVRDDQTHEGCNDDCRENQTPT